MRRRTAPLRTQPMLPLEPEATKPPPVEGSKALLQALADLLLAALAQDRTDPKKREGGDEPEDHA
jgi:hypothetical protein